MKDNEFTISINGQSFWKCLKWELRSVLRGKRNKARKCSIQRIRAKLHSKQNEIGFVRKKMIFVKDFLKWYGYTRQPTYW
jgi:hypothetical protein